MTQSKKPTPKEKEEEREEEQEEQEEEPGEEKAEELEKGQGDSSSPWGLLGEEPRLQGE